MYSAYVQSMALMFHYLFNDPKYAADGALTMQLQRYFGAVMGSAFRTTSRSPSSAS